MARPCIGLFDRQGLHTTDTYLTWPNHAFNSILSGFVIGNKPNGVATASGIAWSDLQPAVGAGVAGTGAFTSTGTSTGTKSLGATAIDWAFKQCDNYNATNPVNPATGKVNFWSLKLRVMLGQWAPTWAKNLDGPITGLGGVTSWQWWTPNALSCWKNLMTKVANYVPAYTVTTTNYGLPLGANANQLAGHPLLGQIEQVLCMTLNEEPLLKDNFSGTITPSLASLGYTWDPKEKAQQQAAVAYMTTAFPNTPWSMASNPATNLDNTGTGGNPDETFTEALMDYLAANGGPLAVLGDDSLRANGVVYPPSTYSDPHSAPYVPMYTHMASYGHGSAFTGLGAHPAIAGIARPAGFVHEVPIYIQTSTLSGMAVVTTAPVLSDLTNTLDYAVWLGARNVELPSGWATTTTSFVPVAPTSSSGGSYGGYQASLIANSPITVASVVPNQGPIAGGTGVTISGTGFIGATAAKFGSTPGTALAVVSATQITVTSPAESAGVVDVRITTPAGTSSITAADAFTFGTVTPPPSVTGVAPTSVIAGNAVVVTITGSAFTGATAVNLGAINIATFSFVDDSHVTATVPATVPQGTYPFTVTTPAGTSTP